jgi:hypothetical protein
MATENTLIKELLDIGVRLGFDVRREVEASESAWVDIVWFDKALPLMAAHKKMRYAPVLPVVAIEVELRTGLNAKHVKGSISNLNNLGAQLGVIVIGQGNIETLLKQPAHSKATKEQAQEIIRDRVYRWVYAEAQPRGRVIIMFENEVRDWSKGLKSATEPVLLKGTASAVP